MDLHAPLISVMPAPLDPTAGGESFQHVAYRGALHSQACGQARGRNSRFFPDARERSVNGNWRFRGAFQFAIESAHAIDERARGKQGIAFKGAASGEAQCISSSLLSG